SAVFRDYSIAHRQPKSGPTTQRFCCKERVKNLCQMLGTNSAAGIAELGAHHARVVRFAPAGANCQASLCLHRVKSVGHQGDEYLLDLPFIDVDPGKRRVDFLDDSHAAEFRMVLDELKRLFEDVIYISCQFFSLSLMRKLQQAVSNRLAAKSFVANDLQVLAEVLFKTIVFELFHASEQRLRTSRDRREGIVNLVNDACRQPAD